MSPLPSNHQYSWNEVSGRYRDINTGRFVSQASVTAELERYLATAQNDMSANSIRLQSGSIDMLEWQLGMERNIKNVHTISAALARGGWAQMTQSDWGWVGRRIRDEYAYLRNFARQVADGTQPMDGRFLTRSRMYALAARSTFQEMRRRYMRLSHGAAFEQRVLTPGAEHCIGGQGRPGCVELANKGVQPVGTLPPIGAAQCLSFCLCHFKFFDVGMNEIGTSTR